MKKILNENISDVVEEMLAGYLQAYKKYYQRIGKYNALKYRHHRKNKVALVIGGGSGHEPLFSGFCGAGLADGVACGNICASPNPELIVKTAEAVEEGKGVLFVYGCYAGDNLNFDMAEEVLNKKGIKTAHVRVWDDCASAPRERIQDRRGIAGDVFVIKIAGAAADAGLDLEEVVRVTEKARDFLNTIGVATFPGTLPGNDFPTFELGEDEVEFGMGLHGEPGIERTKMLPSNKLVDRMYDELKKEMDIKKGEEIVVLVNGLGSTPLLELNLVYYNLNKRLQEDSLIIHDAEIKTWCTCMEMGGFSITILRLDEELRKYYDAPCFSPYYAKGCIDMIETSTEEVIFDEEEQCVEKVDLEKVKIQRSKKGILEELSCIDAKNMLIYIGKKIIKNKPYLTEIDSIIGDGDHGIGMSLGMEKVIEALSREEVESVQEVFEKSGNAMLLSMGGASGVIFGSLYLSGAEYLREKSKISAKDLFEMEKISLEAIKERGKAQEGDKTMVDALAPAVRAMEASHSRGLYFMLKEAEKAAEIGMNHTKSYIAKFGRAKSLMERAIGYQDAGATSVWLIFQGMREFVEGNIEE